MLVFTLSPGTDSAEVDVKIMQIKSGVRAATNLPYLLPFVLLVYAVHFVVSKVNIFPSSSLAHEYSPIDFSLGDPYLSNVTLLVDADNLH